ncbi:MAG: hypothetical protein G8345_05320 [Magnetococcales bacterium]|nr:hypothetical protein [Magnetococcales bacterium]
MEIQLSERASATVQARIASGINQSAEEVVAEAIEMLVRQDEEIELAWLRRAINEGLADEGEPWSLEDAKKSCRNRATSRQ